jgi:4-hydroxythreonine-4-phosphate dehydrogenase
MQINKKMTEKTNIRIGVSVGDLNGVGLEVVMKTFADERMLDFCTPVLFASNKVIALGKKQFGIDFAYNGIIHLNSIIEHKINVMNIWRELPPIQLGIPTPESGKCALESLTAAVSALKEGAVDVLVTAPINKKNIQSEHFHFPGHTDYLAQELEGESLMFMVSDELRVGLLTDHLPLKDVVKNLNQELVEKKIRLMETSLRMDFGIIRPKIAVLGVNPHCGDQGVIGDEEEKIVHPVIQKLYNEGILVFGTYSADSFFVSDYKYFDGIIAPYHDQGLIPFKVMSFGKGVNFTAGLSKIRTSPDHGTAYGIADKGIADESSFRQAVYTAIDIYRQRIENEELLANALDTNSLDKGFLSKEKGD